MQHSGSTIADFVFQNLEKAIANQQTILQIEFLRTLLIIDERLKYED